MHVDDTVVDEALSLMADLSLTMEVTEVSKMSAQAGTILSGLGFSQQMIDGRFTELSGGWKSRCSLAGSLLVQSDVLLLDEPSNFLDLDATLWLERYLQTQTRTVVITSHDQMFLENVVEETILIRNCGLRYFDGTPRAYEINQRKEAKRTGKQREAMAKKKEQIEASIQKGKETAKKTGDENRLRMVKSRQKKLDDRWGIEQSAKGGRFKLNRDLAGYHLTSRAEIAQDEVERRVKMTLPQPSKLRTSGDLIHFQDVAFRYPKTKNNVVEGVSFTVGQTGRCSFIGANGEGKSTIAKLVLGELQPTCGTITRHPTLKIGYFSQTSVEELSALPEERDAPTTALMHFMAYFANKGETVEERDARSFLGGLGLPGKLSSHTPVKALSGGQKVRLAFALIMWDPPHLLLLDEITTHVDAPTIEALALSLRRYSGTIILVTHDRWFNRVVIEGIPPREAFDHDDLDESASESSSDDEENVRKGETYRVGGGKVRLTPGGMTQYIGIVERRMAKREMAAKAG
ncbi:hypothetical protein QFC19_000678 [Naganishia cerealis]|uniref:Uncharacterized protein n=1 Tax=Naganishia cerealis TaxID=610337 RepID=A0ACC2WLN6_9TREE|nr:hypothetical protein QFC19_000678 [Naganishia cerealis]